MVAHLNGVQVVPGSNPGTPTITVVVECKVKKIQIGIIGLGTVGSGVVRLLRERPELLRRKAGVDLVVKKICVRNPRAKRSVKIPPSLLTTRVQDLLRDPEIEIIVELVGGIEPAGSFILEALKAGKHVVTANKALLAERGEKIFEVARRRGLAVQFEASVGGGIPIIKSLREGLVSNRIDAIFGIINGTSNYILTKMSQDNRDFKEALTLAKRSGYAERNPSLDIEGIDTAHKLSILAFLGFGRSVRLQQIYTEGINRISPNDVRYAEELGYAIKLLAIAKRVGRDLEVRVHPTLVPKANPLALVGGVYNAITVRGDLVGNTIFYGQGAGQLPTSSAVLSDLVDLGRMLASGNGVAVSPPIGFESGLRRLRRMGEVRSRYYFRFSVVDQPGVLAQISRILGQHRISISSVIQKEPHEARGVPLVIVTHEALEKDVQRAIRLIDRLDVVRRKTMLLRIEEA